MLLALDYGTKNIGIAISDESKTFAWPYTTITNSSLDEVLDSIVKILKEERIQTIILGLPLNSEGNPTQMSQHIEEFAQKLAERTDIKVEFWNEMLTTKKAISDFRAQNAKLKDKDKQAAQIILQEYLDHHYAKSN